MAKRQKTATPQQPARKQLFTNRSENMRAFYNIVNDGFVPETGGDRTKSEAVDEAEKARTADVAEQEVKPTEVEDETVGAEIEEVEGAETAETVEATEELAETEPVEEVEGAEGEEPTEEVVVSDFAELRDGTRIPMEDLEVMSKTFRNKEGKSLTISEIVEVFNAGIDPTIFLRKGNEVRESLTKDLTAKDAKITSLEQQLEVLTQEAIESKRARVSKPDAALLDTNPAVYNAQMLAYIDSKGETDSKVAELTTRRETAKAKVATDVNVAWDSWHKEPENAEFLKNLSAQEKQQFEAGVLEVLQESYARTGIMMPMAVPMQYTIARLQWEKKGKVDNLASASLSGAQAERRKRMRIVKAAKTQISRGAITTATSKSKSAPSSTELQTKLRKAISVGDQDEVKKILKEARFGE
jgi:hypothetical protein